MAARAKSILQKRGSVRPERTVVYHGIKIVPIAGKRSATAEAIREALRSKPERARGEPTRA